MGRGARLVFMVVLAIAGGVISYLLDDVAGGQASLVTPAVLTIGFSAYAVYVFVRSGRA